VARRPSSGVCASQRQVEQEIIYEKLPADIADRFVLLMDPVLGTGTSASRAIQVCGRTPANQASTQRHEPCPAP
jgi:uracil phosphoribosyltransferase